MMFVQNPELYVCDAQPTVRPPLHHRLTATDSNERTRRERLPLVAMSSRTRAFDFELCSNGWWKKALCTQDIWSGKKMERDGKRQGCKRGPQKLTCQKERKKKARSASRTPNFVFNKFALTWETRVLSGDDFCDLFSVHGFVSQTPDGRSARLSTKEPNDESREASLFGVFTSFADNHQLMNDLFVTLTQIENCRRSRVLLASEIVESSMCPFRELRLTMSLGLWPVWPKVARLPKPKKKTNKQKTQQSFIDFAAKLLRPRLHPERLIGRAFPLPSDVSSVGFGSQRSSSAATLCVAALCSCVGVFAQGRSPLAPLGILLQRRNWDGKACAREGNPSRP